ncbi:MAG: alkaline phosphatase family protein [Nitriliruptorales bacterium]
MPDPATGPDPVRPAYDGAWIGAVVPALLAGDRPEWMPAPVADADGVLLLVLDGLGWHAIEDARVELSELRAMSGGPITTCAPATTAAALTSLTTGVPPGRHGIVGFRIRTDGGVLNVLEWAVDDEAEAPPPEAFQSCAPFGGRPVPVVTRAEFHKSGFTGAYLRGSRFVGWSTTAVLVEHCRRLAAAGDRVALAYYDGVDKVAHRYGLEDGFFAVEAAATDRLVGALLDALPPTWALVVTADHGQVHIAPGARRDLGAVAALTAAYAGDARCRSLHAVPGDEAELAAAAEEAYGDEAWVMTRDEFLDDGWLGPVANQRIAERIGDVIVAAHAPVTFVAPTFPIEADLNAHHGSFTAAEMLVPLLAARGRAG